MLKKAIKKSHISQQDLENSLRLKAKITELCQVKVARLESNGDISVIPKEKPPKMIEFSVETGGKTLRIQLN